MGKISVEGQNYSCNTSANPVMIKIILFYRINDPA